MRLENTPVLETGRLLLRPFRPEDRVAILNIFGDWEANVYLPWFPLQTLEEANAFLKSGTAGCTASPGATAMLSV